MLPPIELPTDDVLDVPHVSSSMLQLGRSTIYELVGRNAIPHTVAWVSRSVSAAWRSCDGWIRGHRRERRKGNEDACTTRS